MPCERNTPIFTTRVAHKSWRDVKYPMLFGMGPVSWLSFRHLHPNICTRVGLGVKCYIHKWNALHSALYYLSHPCFISLGIMAQNNPSRLQKTPLRHGYPLENKECQNLNALGNSVPKSPQTKVCALVIIISAHKMFAIFVTKI